MSIISSNSIEKSEFQQLSNQRVPDELREHRTNRNAGNNNVELQRTENSAMVLDTIRRSTH